MERSARNLYERWDTGPITAALNARLPSSPSPLQNTQRQSLLNDASGSWDSLRSAIAKASTATGASMQPRSLSSSSAVPSSIGRMTGTDAAISRNLPRQALMTYPERSPTGGLSTGSWANAPSAIRSTPGAEHPLRSSMRSTRDAIDAYRMQQAMQPDPGAGWGDPGGMGNPTGGNWDKVNQWNGLISQAVQRVASEMGVTVPANVVKAVMELESGGNMVGCNAWGYCGLMQTGPGSWINGFNAAYNSTPEGNIYYGVQELANWYNAVGTGNWEDAAAAYFSGYNYNKPNVSDGYGTTVAQYRQRIRDNLAVLSSAGGGSWSGQSGVGSNALQTMFGGQFSAPDWGAFGVTSSNGLYGYGTSYGLNGVQHTGLDVPLPLGSPIYAPAQARVVCVACGAFGDTFTGGVGRIELEMPDGTRVIYGHSNQSFVQVGQVVQAGQQIGTSGGMVSPHIHLEVRVRDASMPSGWRLIDPVAYFSGMGGSPYGGSSGVQRNQPLSTHQTINRLLGRNY
jgi:murein DD-endopeptidase MepM/ murein hydrolase activator NlpD